MKWLGKLFKSQCSELMGALFRAFNRAAISVLLMLSLVSFAGGLVLILDPGVLSHVLGFVAGKWLSALGAVLCFMSGFMFWQAILLSVEQRRVAQGLRENDKELALDNQKTEYEKKLSELTRQIDEKAKKLDEAKGVIAELTTENRRLKKECSMLHFDSFERALGLVLCKAEFHIQDWHHDPVAPVKVSYAVNDQLKFGHRTYSRDYFIGYIDKKLSINLGVDLNKVRVLRAPGTITVYGVKSKPFGLERFENRDELFLRYTAEFEPTKLPPTRDGDSPSSIAEQTPEKEIDDYKINCGQRFYDSVEKDRYRFDRAEGKKGAVCFGGKELNEWKEVRGKRLKDKIFNADDQMFKFMHQNTVNLFRELLTILLKPLNCAIVIDETGAMPDGAVTLKELCEKNNAEQMKQLR